MIPLLFAAVSAVVWGVGDFCGGKASQRGDAFVVALLAEVVGIPVLFVVLLVTEPHPPSSADLAWGAAAGAVGVLALVLFYKSMASGAMSVVAPVTATTTAAVPLVLGLLIDRTPSRHALAGAVVAVVAITLVNISPKDRDATVAVPRRILGLSLLAGIMFGGYLALLAQPSHSSGVWPLVAARVAGITTLAAVMRMTGVPLRGVRVTWALSTVAGAFDIVANACYLAAVHEGVLSIVGPIASLYPVSTVILAMVVDRERMRPIQVVGLGLAATALVLTGG